VKRVGAGGSGVGRAGGGGGEAAITPPGFGRGDPAPVLHRAGRTRLSAPPERGSFEIEEELQKYICLLETKQTTQTGSRARVKTMPLLSVLILLA